MPAGRPNRPLFDLIAENGDDARRRTAPTPAEPAVELKPSPAPRARPQPTQIDRPEVPQTTRPLPRGLWGSLVSTGRAHIELTTPWVAAGTAIILAILLGTWIIAYKVGESEATRRLAGGTSEAPPRGNPTDATEPPTARGPAAGNETGSGTHPITEQTSDPVATGSEATPRTSTEPPAIEGVPAANPTDSGAVVAFNGTYEADPRKPGLNYLVLASSMNRQDVREAVDFLGQNGFRALGVPYGAVDRSGRAGKNDPLYKLVSAQGFDGSEMKESQARRTDMAEEVQRLGQIYQRQHRGKYNFAKVNWEKYVR